MYGISEVRLFIYQYLLCFEEIEIGSRLDDKNVDPRRDGLWLQHNPPSNPLAIMPVSRQLYNEAREVFYGLNKFTFESFAVLPVFLIGIGPKNAMLLRSVWQKKDQNQWENIIDNIRQCLSLAMVNSMAPEREVTTRIAEDPYRRFLSQGLSQPLPEYWQGNHHLLRPEVASGPSRLDRWRYKIYANFWKEGRQGRLCWKRKVVYELCVQHGQEDEN